MWFFRNGEWRQGRLMAYERNVVLVEATQTVTLLKVPRHCVTLHMPADCGAPHPPTGQRGIEYWLVVNPLVFANVWGVGQAIPRPCILWQ